MPERGPKRYAVQEYTSLVDGKVRVRVVPNKLRNEARGLLGGHFHGHIDGVSYQEAKRIADNQRLENKMDRQWNG